MNIVLLGIVLFLLAICQVSFNNTCIRSISNIRKSIDAQIKFNDEQIKFNQMLLKKGFNAKRKSYNR
jgi:hypothetical protein